MSLSDCQPDSIEVLLGELRHLTMRTGLIRTDLIRTVLRKFGLTKLKADIVALDIGFEVVG